MLRPHRGTWFAKAIKHPRSDRHAGLNMPEPKPRHLNAARTVRIWTFRLTPIALLAVIVLTPLESTATRALAASVAAVAGSIIALTWAITKAATLTSTAAATLRTATTMRALGYVLLGAVAVGAIWLIVSLVRNDRSDTPAPALRATTL